LRQSSFSEVDRYCSPERQAAMLRVVIHCIDRAQQAVEAGIEPGRIAALPVLATLARMGEEFGEDRIEAIEPLWNEIDTAFHGLAEASDGVH